VRWCCCWVREWRRIGCSGVRRVELSAIGNDDVDLFYLKLGQRGNSVLSRLRLFIKALNVRCDFDAVAISEEIMALRLSWAAPADWSAS
jgi:hypothetical protein